MSDVSRYNLDPEKPGFAPAVDGAWVLHSDYAALQARLAAEADYDRRQAEHLRTVVDRLNAEVTRLTAQLATARRDALDRVQREVEGYLPEFGAGEPQDGTDRIIDQCWRDFRKVIVALIAQEQEPTDVSIVSGDKRRT